MKLNVTTEVIKGTKARTIVRHYDLPEETTLKDFSFAHAVMEGNLHSDFMMLIGANEFIEVKTQENK